MTDRFQSPLRSAGQRPSPIRGTVIPERRFTRWAGIYFTVFLCLPFLSFCLTVDLLLYLVFRQAFDSCYSLLCLLN